MGQISCVPLVASVPEGPSGRIDERGDVQIAFKAVFWMLFLRDRQAR